MYRWCRVLSYYSFMGTLLYKKEWYWWVTYDTETLDGKKLGKYLLHEIIWNLVKKDNANKFS